MTEDEIIVKVNADGRYWPEIDTDKLTEIQWRHLHILRIDFPLDEVKLYDAPPAPPPPPDQLEESIRSQKERDSIKKNTPELLNPLYYDFLLKKAAVNTKDIFSFSTKTIKISKEEFKRIVDLINRSGYWKMPYQKKSSGASDAGYYILEANNGKKYNAVYEEDGFYGIEELSKACHELIKIAKVLNIETR